MFYNDWDRKKTDLINSMYFYCSDAREGLSLLSTLFTPGEVKALLNYPTPRI